MSADFDLSMAYHMGYEDALARRTPEPSKASLLGRGTCHDVSENPLRYECSECGAVSLEIAPLFCPACGREVVTNG